MVLFPNLNTLKPVCRKSFKRLRVSLPIKELLGMVWKQTSFAVFADRHEKAGGRAMVIVGAALGGLGVRSRHCLDRRSYRPLEGRFTECA